MRRVLLTLVVASMIIVAGCSGGPSGTDTPTPTTDTGDETVSPGDDDNGTTPVGDGPPPGVNDGTVNASAIAAAHRSVVRGSSFRMDVSREGGPNPFSLTLYNGSGSIRLDLEDLEEDRLTQLYLSNDGVATRLNNSRSPPKAYGYGATGIRTGVGFAYGLFSLVYPGQPLTLGTYEVDGTITQDGEELTRLSATGVNDTAADRRDFAAVNGTLTGLSGEVLVRSDGLVREMTLEQTFDSGATRTITFNLTGLQSTSAAEPDWLDEAPRLEGSLSEDGTVMELSHSGGPEVPADTTLTLESGGFGGGLTPTNVTLPESVSEGDSVYVYATGSPTIPTVEVSVNDEPSPSDALNLSQFSPQISGTLGEVRFAIGVPEENGTDDT